MPEAPTLPPPTVLTGWGLHPRVRGIELTGDFVNDTARAALSRGLGRSYGDASLPADGDSPVASSLSADRIIAFDQATGVIRAEAGVKLSDLNTRFLPQGWFTPVSPGTQHVTVGGMVAADVHGKNHHVNGCFGRHVRSLRLRVADGRIVECSRQQEPDLFRATLGGMGLTGHILDVEFTLEAVPSPWIVQETRPYPSLEALVEHLLTASRRWPFTVTWCDCLKRGAQMGRGIVISGRWAEPGEARPGHPRTPPSMPVPAHLPRVLSAAGVGLFNELYFRRHGSRVRHAIVSPQAFFYQLDRVSHWNRLYGRAGFTQHQCVLPGEPPACLGRFFEILTARPGAYLCVIKDCGREGEGLLSFPRPGISIALDIPIRAGTQALVDALNELVAAEGGRIYLAKDALTRAEHFRAMEPRLEAFNAVRRRWDPARRIRSALSVRLMGDGGKGIEAC